MPASALGPARTRVPVRTIIATIGLVLVTAIALLLLYQVREVLVWIVIAIFFTTALYPVTGWVERRVTGGRRTLATLLVFLVVVVVIAALLAVFAVPLAQEGASFATQLPGVIDDARNGRGVVGRLMDRTHILSYVQAHQDKITAFVSGLTTPAAGVLRGVATGVAGVITVFVLTLLMVLEGPKVVDGALNLIEDTDSRERVRRVGADCAKSITGYISGNLLISIICGVLAYAVLKISGVPFAGLIALFVALADLIPLVGATLGAIVALIAAAVHSVPALIAVAVFVVLYQQLENHVLQPVIFARTVKLNPLAVLVAILVGVDLAGILGALLAIPVAGIIQVVLRDVWDHRRGRTKEEVTVGEDEAPAVA
ncbi:AI-2E family transporter [uncultured Friedmanniella sp.]|uniref:AI-2E family transporter n=1 Tax=uncultured Friedmanniella sp. TaxID=335381 RepID=UPI0035CA24EE